MLTARLDLPTFQLPSFPPSLFPSLRLASLAGLAVTTAAALGFEGGATSAYQTISRRTALAAEQPALVARATLLVPVLAAPADASAEIAARRELEAVLDQLESAGAALRSLVDIDAQQGRKAPSIANVDGRLRAFVADARDALDSADARQALQAAGPEVARLVRDLGKLAGYFSQQQQDAVDRRALLVQISCWGVLACFALLGASLVGPRLGEGRPDDDWRAALDSLGPADRDSTAAAAAPAHAPLLIPQPTPRHAYGVRGRTLVCIGAHGLREAVSDRLRLLGFDVEATADPEEARAAVETARFGLIVLDSAAMPAARRLESSPAGVRAGCIAIAQAGESEAKLRELGADVVVASPLLPKEIEAAAALAIGALTAGRAA